jgi:hypothetical protein
MASVRSSATPYAGFVSLDRFDPLAEIRDFLAKRRHFAALSARGSDPRCRVLLYERSAPRHGRHEALTLKFADRGMRRYLRHAVGGGQGSQRRQLVSPAEFPNFHATTQVAGYLLVKRARVAPVHFHRRHRSEDRTRARQGIDTPGRTRAPWGAQGRAVQGGQASRWPQGC